MKSSLKFILVLLSVVGFTLAAITGTTAETTTDGGLVLDPIDLHVKDIKPATGELPAVDPFLEVLLMYLSDFSDFLQYPKALKVPVTFTQGATIHKHHSRDNEASEATSDDADNVSFSDGQPEDERLIEEDDSSMLRTLHLARPGFWSCGHICIIRRTLSWILPSACENPSFSQISSP